MIYPTDANDNQAAYLRLRDAIARDYPRGQFVAIAGGKIVADAPTFKEVAARLRALGQDSPETLVVEAGIHYPDFVTIFLARHVNDTCTD